MEKILPSSLLIRDSLLITKVHNSIGTPKIVAALIFFEFSFGGREQKIKAVLFVFDHLYG